MKNVFSILILASALAPISAFADLDSPNIVCMNEGATALMWFADTVVADKEQTAKLDRVNAESRRILVTPKSLGDDKFQMVEVSSKDKPGSNETYSCTDLSKMHL